MECSLAELLIWETREYEGPPSVHTFSTVARGLQQQNE